LNPFLSSFHFIECDAQLIIHESEISGHVFVSVNFLCFLNDMSPRLKVSLPTYHIYHISHNTHTHTISHLYVQIIIPLNEIIDIKSKRSTDPIHSHMVELNSKSRNVLNIRHIFRHIIQSIDTKKVKDK
jgi:hypothetical protein